MLVDVQLTNYDDLIAAEHGWLTPDEVRHVSTQASVDKKNSYLALPEDIVEKLGMRIVDRPKVLCSDGARRPRAEYVYLELLGRHGVFNATVRPKGETAVVGTIVLNELDLVDDQNGLAPPDPDYVVVEIE
ncbi:MAG: hypothetical protein U0793_26510 [Gemmataceae bacterium]